MASPGAAESPTSEGVGESVGQHLHIPNYRSATSSLRHMYMEGSASGLKTPATPDERTSLLASASGGDDLESGSVTKQPGE